MIKYMKQNDTEPPLRAQLKRVTANPLQTTVVDLDGATIKFIMRHYGSGVVKVEATLAGTEIVDASNGQVQYEWDAADTDTCGDFLCEFEVTDSGSGVGTYWDLRTAQEMDDAESPEPLIVRIVDDFA